MPVADNGATARLFFALWPDEALRSRLAETARAFKDTARGNWVKPANLHLTLAFLGDIEAERWPELSRIAADTQAPEFTLRLDRFEFWPRNGIVCLAPSRVPRALGELAAGLANRLGEAGLLRETRPYRAHLTLARQGRCAHRALSLAEPVTWSIRTFCLVESRLGKEGPSYLPWATWPLHALASGASSEDTGLV